jgi:hypothetical protein
MRIVGKIEARLRVGGATRGIDLEGAYLPVGRDRPHNEEESHESRKEKQESTAPAPALVFGFSNRPFGEAHPRSTLAPSGYDLSFASPPGAASCHGFVTTA